MMPVQILSGRQLYMTNYSLTTKGVQTFVIRWVVGGDRIAFERYKT